MRRGTARGRHAPSRPRVRCHRYAHRCCDGGERNTDRTRAQNAAQKMLRPLLHFSEPVSPACHRRRWRRLVRLACAAIICGRVRPAARPHDDVHELSGMPESTTVEATFVFADIAGFTALTEAHGDHDAAALVADFCRSVRAELPASGGTEVKTIGDAVMLTIPDPAAAIRLGLRITHELMRGARRAGGPRRSPSRSGDRARRRLLRRGGQPRGTRLRRGKWRRGAAHREYRGARGRARGGAVRAAWPPGAPKRARARGAVRGGPRG